MSKVFLVKLPDSFAWDAWTLLGIGTVTKEPREIELSEDLAKHLVRKGIEVIPRETSSESSAKMRTKYHDKKEG